MFNQPAVHKTPDSHAHPSSFSGFRLSCDDDGFLESPPSLEFQRPGREGAKHSYTLTLTALPEPTRTPAAFTIEPAVSDDLQWHGLKAQPDNILMVSSWKKGSLGVYPSRLSCLRFGRTQLTLQLDYPPAHPVYVNLTLPSAAFKITGGSEIEFAAGESQKIVTISSVLPYPATILPDNITISSTVSRDRQYAAVAPNTTSVEIYSTVQGQVQIFRGPGGQEPVSEVLRFRANSFATFVIKFVKPGRYSVDGALLPIYLPSTSGLKLHGQWVDKFGLSLPLEAMGSYDLSRDVLVEVQAITNATGPVNISFGSLESQDIQWNGVVPSISAITVEAMPAGSVYLSPGQLTVICGSTGSVNITLNFPPAQDVVLHWYSLEGFQVPSNLTIPAGERFSRLPIQALLDPQTPRPLVVQMTQSADVSFDQLLPENSVVVSSVKRGEFLVEGLPSSTIQMFTNDTLSLTLQLVSHNPYPRGESGIIPISLSSHFRVHSPSYSEADGGIVFSSFWSGSSQPSGRDILSIPLNITATVPGASGEVSIGPIVSGDAQWDGLAGKRFQLTGVERGVITVTPLSLNMFLGSVRNVSVQLSAAASSPVILNISGALPAGFSLVSPNLEKLDLHTWRLTLAPGEMIASMLITASEQPTFPEVLYLSNAVSDDLQFSDVTPSVQQWTVYSTSRGLFKITNPLSSNSGSISVPLGGSSDLLQLDFTPGGLYSLPSGGIVPVEVPSGIWLRVNGLYLQENADTGLVEVPFGPGKYGLALMSDGSTAGNGPRTLRFRPIISDDIQWQELSPEISSFAVNIRSLSGEMYLEVPDEPFFVGSTWAITVRTEVAPTADVRVPVALTGSDGFVLSNPEILIRAGSMQSGDLQIRASNVPSAAVLELGVAVSDDPRFADQTVSPSQVTLACIRGSLSLQPPVLEFFPISSRNATLTFDPPPDADVKVSFDVPPGYVINNAERNGNTLTIQRPLGLPLLQHQFSIAVDERAEPLTASSNLAIREVRSLDPRYNSLEPDLGSSIELLLLSFDQTATSPPSPAPSAGVHGAGSSFASGTTGSPTGSGAGEEGAAGFRVFETNMTVTPAQAAEIVVEPLSAPDQDVLVNLQVDSYLLSSTASRDEKAFVVSDLYLFFPAGVAQPQSVRVTATGVPAVVVVAFEPSYSESVRWNGLTLPNVFIQTTSDDDVLGGAAAPTRGPIASNPTSPTIGSGQDRREPSPVATDRPTTKVNSASPTGAPPTRAPRPNPRRSDVDAGDHSIETEASNDSQVGDRSKESSRSRATATPTSSSVADSAGISDVVASSTDSTPNGTLVL